MKKYIDLSDVVLCDQVETYLKSKSKSTASTYRTNLKRIRKFLDTPIPEFINEVEEQRIENKGLPAVERKRLFDEKINEFIGWMKEVGYANNPIRGSLTALQNLFDYYQIPVTYKFVKVPPPVSKKKNSKHKWRSKEIKKFVENASSYRYKEVIPVMFQSGMAVGEVCSLNYGDVASGLKSGELPLLIDYVREKNHNRFKTLIGADAVKYLKLYLGTRGELSDDDPLFTKQGSEERITEGAIQMRMRELADEVFGIKEGVMNPYRPHSLWSAFRSQLTGKTDTDLIKFWMGDKLGPKAGAYLNLPDEEHRELYSAVEHCLSIETTSRDAVKEVAEKQGLYLKRLSEVEQVNDTLRRLVNSLKSEIDELTEKNKESTEMVGELAEKLGSLEGLKERIEELEDYVEIGVLRKEAERIRGGK